ncbi:D-ribose pyranase [Micromonospora sp. WMMD1128]|uniref:D-ribose pyranase n=1 Tax=unclassified Micromonospora TaxID=2617518 RepID=UPI00248C6C7D|nr:MULTISPECIES: D-ribose pyranase [unclassified Micromonospora]WBB77227.1 D-ribose pyranase [Micromonospora sp. WMMD1128]WFE36818.1 D-ribose pyranase [Micromonospora sp. WMMD975]
MRRDGIWHPRLAGLLTAMGHHDSIVIADAGLPVPRGVETIDLVWSRGQPALLPVLRAVCAELPVQEAVLAHELSDVGFLAGVRAAVGDVPTGAVAHDELKALCADAHAVVRTGEATPYANVILRAGVAF